MRPTLLKSPTLATPTTSVAKTNGAIIILIKRRKISLNMLILEANTSSSAAVCEILYQCPSKIASNIPINIRAVKLTFTIKTYEANLLL